MKSLVNADQIHVWEDLKIKMPVKVSAHTEMTKPILNGFKMLKGFSRKIKKAK